MSNVAGTAAVKLTPLRVTDLVGSAAPLQVADPVSPTLMSLNVPVALLLQALVAASATAVRRVGPTTIAAASAIESMTSTTMAPRWWLRMIVPLELVARKSASPGGPGAVHTVTTADVKG